MANQSHKNSRNWTFESAKLNFRTLSFGNEDASMSKLWNCFFSNCIPLKIVAFVKFVGFVRFVCPGPKRFSHPYINIFPNLSICQICQICLVRSEKVIPSLSKHISKPINFEHSLSYLNFRKLAVILETLWFLWNFVLGLCQQDISVGRNCCICQICLRFFKKLCRC